MENGSFLEDLWWFTYQKWWFNGDLIHPYKIITTFLVTLQWIGWRENLDEETIDFPIK